MGPGGGGGGGGAIIALAVLSVINFAVVVVLYV